MGSHRFAVTAILIFAFSFPSLAAEKPKPAQGNQNQPKKVWTNQDLDQLRARGLISIVGPDLNATTTSTSAAPSGPTVTVYTSRFEDPEWYAEKAADLQAELDNREAALQQERTDIALAADRITQPGINLAEPTIAITPQAALAILEAQVDEVQSQLDELSDLARQNGISPEVLRS